MQEAYEKFEKNKTVGLIWTQEHSISGLTLITPVLEYRGESREGGQCATECGCFFFFFMIVYEFFMLYLLNGKVSKANERCLSFVKKKKKKKKFHFDK